ncbi:hypothetical protein [Mycobacterium sp. NPDC004974]
MSLLSLRAAVFGVTGAALVTGMVACSSGSNTESPGTSTAASASESTSAAASAPAAAPHGAFTDCLTEHGIPAPPEGAPPGPPPAGTTPPPGAPTPPLDSDGKPFPPPGIDRAQWDDAMQACHSLAPQPPQQ